ncbi:hypothetical protein TRFO_23711 [Tritrichomonas foetus]|uniref:THH1/TOM1/TOM3 domain-containing protein n=1 Tax=Tritrichomonas foetus TaxID=1144522 RepID=A0A1J4KAS3_9EUKA|nr:hypothetical protein TRFO_23711 [Tritrichomonas foetus]|eukprot:OHT08000.1 hypothetical protein TRFO_23711 [Tritrichomonas foetus]
MTILGCLDENQPVNWSLSFKILGIIFSVFFLIALIFFLVYIKNLVSQKRIVIVSQILLLLTILIKALSYFLALLLFRKIINGNSVTPSGSFLNSNRPNSIVLNTEKYATQSIGQNGLNQIGQNMIKILKRKSDSINSKMNEVNQITIESGVSQQNQPGNSKKLENKSPRQYIQNIQSVHSNNSEPYSNSNSTHVSFYGLILFETPCYFSTTCYSITLLAWLVSCLSFLPAKMQRFARKASISIYTINAVIYATFLADLILEYFYEYNRASSITSTIIIVLRDFLMGIAFIVFLKCGFGISNYSKASTPEKRLIMVSVVFTVILILRAVVIVIQTIFETDTSDECSTGFHLTFWMNELIFELFPLAILAVMHCSHLLSRSMMQIVQADDALLSSGSVNRPLLRSTEA